MGLKSIRIQNFKCFRDSGEIPFAPLTVIVGRNSSGKSSIIQPWLLLKQTLESRGFANTINLGGPLYDAGAFSEMVHKHETNRTIRLDLTLDIRGPWELVPGEAVPLSAIYLENLKNRGPIQAKLSLVVAPKDPYGPQINEITIDCSGRPPLVLIYKAGLRSEGEGAWELRSPPTVNWRVVRGPGPLFPVILDEGSPGELDEGENVLPYNLVFAFVERFLKVLHALGPFRDPPRRRYDFAGKVFTDIGLGGEHAVDTLIAETLGAGTRLIDRISNWLSNAGLARRFSLHRLGDQQPLSYQVQFEIGDNRANYSDVGFGLSQVLPVLVQGLRTPEGGLFVCQQPELHLHPDAQVALADFFASLVADKRNVFVETHSEHLILGIRRMLAEEKRKASPKLTSEMVSLLYVDDSAPGESKVLPLTLDDEFNITNWPPGFMDEATEERLRIMGAALKGD
jgi:hypothetical protein